ncbi:hypothetical protein B0H17DRAFT_1217810 [Mycena rosella]|uniref:Uncharacterized protein n=1 Tax=Mycena rosella TaxID=1033263 RepID=A0AAD7BVH9_MYCRO|nr:hypothetical protein B0H17DRAFT_1217810 [Mycena rosella]
MGKSRAVKRRPCTRRSSGQKEVFAAHRNVKTAKLGGISAESSTRSTLPSPSAQLPTSSSSQTTLPSPSTQLPTDSDSAAAHTPENLQKLLTETTQLLNNALEELADKDYEVDDIANELDQRRSNCRNEVEDLLNELKQHEFANYGLRRDLAASKHRAALLSATVTQAQQQSNQNYSLLRNERRKTTRARTTTKATQTLLHLRDLDIAAAEEQSVGLKAANKELEETIAALEATKHIDSARIDSLHTQAAGLRKKIRKFQMRSARAPTVKSNAPVHSPESWKDMAAPKSLWASSSRMSAKPLECESIGGCPGALLGGVSAKEVWPQKSNLPTNYGRTLDGTSHRNIEYQGRHVTLRVPNYVDDSPPIPRVRLLGVDSDTDHSSETQVKGLVSALTEISDLFNRCPSLRQDEIKMSLNTFFSKLKAMHGDHAADGKKITELKLVVEAANDAKIADAGGQAAWDELSKEEQEQASSRTAAEIKTAFGLEVYEQMTDDEQRAFDMLLWGGCCMYKELNAAKGGSEGMKAWWKAHPDIQGPTLLANRDNAATLGDMTKINEETNSAQRRALNASEAGGVKTTLLAGNKPKGNRRDSQTPARLDMVQTSTAPLN